MAMTTAAELQTDIERLHEAGYDTEPLVKLPGETLVIFPRFPLPAGRYNMESCRLLVRVPDGYPNAALDMFYTQPDLALASGAAARQSEVLQQVGTDVWRRFSWHRNAPWIPGRDSFLAFVSFIEDNFSRGQ